MGPSCLPLTSRMRRNGDCPSMPKGQISPRSCGKYSRRLSHTWAWMNQKSYLSTGKRIGAVSRRRSSLSWGRRPRKILRKARHELSSLNSEGCPQAHQTPPLLCTLILSLPQ
nr:hypothetical protein - mouse [Mus musculus]